MSEKQCGAGNAADTLRCAETQGHNGGHQAKDERGVLFTWFGRYDADKEPASPPQPEDGPDYVIPNAVRARVELHRAQTAYDLTVLRAKLDTLTVSTAESRRLRGRREQLTAELDAWAYLAKIARSPR